jgi:hypothetical protein
MGFSLRQKSRRQDLPRMPRYSEGPISDHFNGERSFDSHGVPLKTARWAATTS